ncbi:MAG: MarR family transcriptional regulator [Mycobacterium sp.]
MDATNVEQGVGYLVKRVQQAMRRRCDAALRPIGLSMSQYAVLRALADHPDASAAELARLCFVTRQSLQDVLGGLRSAGYVDDADSTARGRARALRLTSAGRRTLDSAHDAVLGVESQMLQGIPDSRQAQLAAALAQCAQSLENLPPD